MKYVSGSFNGTGADLYIGIGFIPDFVRVWNCEASTSAVNEWNCNMRAADAAGGFAIAAAATKVALAAGIAIYRGGTKLTSASTVYLKKDPAPDKRASGTLGTISKWTLDTSGNRTGKFDYGCNTSYVGEGSKIRIDGKWYFITALTNDGDADDEVTLSEAAPTGNIEFISGMYDYIGGSTGDIIPAGFFIDSTAVCNVSGEYACFEAGTYL